MNQASREAVANPEAAALPPSTGTDRLLALIDSAWPESAAQREVANLPRPVFDSLSRGRKGGALAQTVAHFDRTLPGWPELAAAAVAQAAPGGLDERLQRACLLLSRRPLRKPGPLLSALESCSPESDSRFWLLVALSGTDTSDLRAAWLRLLRKAATSRPAGRVAWFAFLRACLGGWLAYPDFRDYLTHSRLLDAASPGQASYRPALARIGLWSNPLFAKWYQEVVYEAAHQPDVSLSFEAAGWIRGFPGEEYLWDALTRLEQHPDSWWALHLLRWTSGLQPEAEEFLRRLREASPLSLCLVSLLRPDLCPAAGALLSAPEHESVVHWLRHAGPSAPLDPEWVDLTLRPWAERVGESIILAAGVLCSVEVPPDFPGPAEEAPRRRAFVRSHLVPEFDRFMDNIFYLYAVRGEHFSILRTQAERGRPAALRALALWPEQTEEAASILFSLTRRGTKAARQAAQEALDHIKRRSRADDLAHLERRLDLASAWADAGLDGKPSRVWWDVGGYRVKLSVARGNVVLDAYSRSRRLAALPKRVREDRQYDEIRGARSQLARAYRYFRRRFEQAMVDEVSYSGPEFSLLLANPVVRSLTSRLLLLLDGRPFRWDPPDPMEASAPPDDIAAAARLSIAHPLHLRRIGVLQHWQQHIIDHRVAQPFKQLFRETYLIGDDERTSHSCPRFSGRPLSAPRAFALLRERGYSPGRGVAVRDWPSHHLSARIRWAAPHENPGRLLGLADPDASVTSGPIWFETTAGERLPLADVPPVLFSETLRDADLVVSLAAAGELGFTSAETRRLRATLIRYLTRALGLTSVYVSDDDAHVIVEGSRATYRVHLGSGSVLLEHTRRHLDLGALRSLPMEALLAESMDSFTARILGTIAALAHDHDISDPPFLSQLDT